MLSKRTPIKVAALATAVVLALAGCTAAPEEQAADDEAVLIIGSESEIPSLDPHTINGTVGLRVTDAVYETLLKEDLQTETKSAAEVIPGLASEWDVSEDGLSYTFTIREGVTFHDGTELTAEAVLANFARLLDEESPLYSDVAAANMTFLTRYISDVEAAENTVTVSLESPFAELPRLLTDRRMAIISPTALEAEGDNIGRAPVGTGPFTIETVSQGQQLEFTRNEEYWDGRPGLAGIVFVTIQDQTTMATSLETGQIDVILFAGPEQVSRLSGNDNVVIQYPDPANQYFIRFNTEAEPTDDVKVRQALNYAVNREAIEALLNDQVRPSYGAIPVGSAAWDESIEPSYEYNPERAAELLEEAGVTLPLEIDIFSPSSGPGFAAATDIMSLVQQDLAAVDVNLNVEYVEFTSMVALESPGYEPNISGSFNGWSTGADSAFWLERMFGPDQVPPNGVNRGWYVNDELRDIFEAARETVDAEERGALYREAGGIITEDAPWLFMYQNRLPRIFNANVHGIVEAPSTFIDYSNVTKTG
ncbi:peptide/nickel transport system substrate-binding protein [Arthrobacter pigmenti]|uniref:Peptide/nickel transport system substrate-binding protein n=1 Tax=Arthrobacter pigmenti TaxID=271432 RepID=A0A846RJZ7_9MICC|nr:ABC transporter substrate-binding protein [Arthrobacter pigmenti]NJC23638.1 peptide/nickel transport system substrate-binding protein [Arthrobacter pigmenti]